jgi:hypothetical protein
VPREFLVRNWQLLLSDIFQFFKPAALAKMKGPIETKSLCSVFDLQLSASLEAKL